MERWRVKIEDMKAGPVMTAVHVIESLHWLDMSSAASERIPRLGIGSSCQ